MAQSSDRVRVVLGDPELSQEVRTELRLRGVQIVSPPEATDVPSDAPLLAEARSAFEDLEPARALARLESWIDSIDRGQLGTTRERLLDGLLLSAQAANAAGNPSRATEALERAFVVDPTHRPEPARYPPSIRTEWEAMQPVEAIVVQVDGPRGLRVGVDGNDPTEGPHSLVPGPHVLRLVAPGHLERRARFDVGTHLNVRLQPDPFAALRDAVAIDQEVRAAAAQLGATPLMVGRRGNRVWARDGGDLGRARVESGNFEGKRLVEALWALPAITTPTSTRDPAEVAPPRRVWRWALIAIAGAAVIAGGAAGLARRNSANGWEARYRP